MISGLLSSGANEDTDDNEIINSNRTSSSGTDTVMSDTKDSVEVTEKSGEISEGSDEKVISEKTETLDLSSISTDNDSSLKSRTFNYMSKSQSASFKPIRSSQPPDVSMPQASHSTFQLRLMTNKNE